MRSGHACSFAWTLGAILILAPAAARAADDAELYARAFGHAAAQTVPIRFELGDRQAIGTVPARLSPTMAPDAVRFHAAPLLEQLLPLLVPEAQARISARVDASGELSVGDLNGAGLAGEFDHGLLLLRVKIPPTVRRIAAHTLDAGGGRDEAKIDASTVSGFLNVRAAEDLVWQPGVAGVVRAPALVDLEAAANVSGFVLESRADLLAGPGFSWRQGETHLVHDDPAHLLRITAGDFTATGWTLAASRPLLGVNVARNFSIDPSHSFLPDDDFDLFLERPSRVDVVVNGQKLQTLQLPAGRHVLQSLHLPAGSADVALEVTDDLGVHRTVRLRTALDAAQLREGAHQFSYGVGMAASSDDSGRAYDLSRPTLRLLHRTGVSRSVTLGGFVQADPHAQLAGADALWATWAGTVSASAAASRSDGNGLGYAGQLRYEYRRAGGFARSFVVGASAQYASDGFFAAGDLAPRQGSSTTLGAWYAHSFYSGINARVEATVRSAAFDPAPRWTFSAALSRTFKNGLGLTVEALRGPGIAAEDDLQARATLIWAWPTAHRSVVVRTSLARSGAASGEVTADQQVTALRGTGDLTATLASDAQQTRTSESARYVGGRVEAELSHAWSTLPEGGAVNALHAEVGTAVVFADGVFAWSRPVRGGFAVVAPQKGLRGAWIGVNPQPTGSYAAAADALGPAVISDLQPYTANTLRLDAPTLDVGQTIGDELRTVRTGYHGGALLRVGAAGSVYVTGRLVQAGPEGTPVANQTGLLVPRGGGAPASPVVVFTNSDGRFALMGIEPGDYDLKVDGGAWAPVPVHVEVQSGLLEAGTLTVPAARP